MGAASLQLLETRIDAMVLRADYARTIGDDGARLRELPEATQIPPLAAGGGVLIPEWSLGDALTAVLAIPLRVLRLDDDLGMPPDASLDHACPAGKPGAPFLHKQGAGGRKACRIFQLARRHKLEQRHRATFC